MATDYSKVHGRLRDFLDHYGKKVAEDPNRTAPSEEDLKEGKSQTTEVNKGDGTKQGPAGTEMAAEVKANSVAGTGNSVEDGVKNTGAPEYRENAKATETSPVAESPSPEDDLEKMKNIDPAIKKAYAQQFVLENSVMNVIDRYFSDKTASQEQPKSEEGQEFSEADVKQAADIISTAEAYKRAHIEGLCKSLNITAKVANDILNQVADENPAAILPPEAMTDADAEAIMAEAAAADAAGVEGGAPGVEEGAPEGEVPVEEGGETDDAALTEQIAAELEPVIAQLTEEGFSEEEIASAILEEGGITEEDIVAMATDELVNQGYTPEESTELIQALGELQQQGATPEELAEVLGQSV